jgi:hypothetical protein
MKNASDEPASACFPAIRQLQKNATDLRAALQEAIDETVAEYATLKEKVAKWKALLEQPATSASVNPPAAGAPRLSTLDWLRERRDSCFRIAASCTEADRADRDGWLEDAEYFRDASETLERVEVYWGVALPAQPDKPKEGGPNA